MNYQSGQVSRTLIILAIVLALAIGVVYFAIWFASSYGKQAAEVAPEEEVEPQPIHEVQIGDIRIIFDSATDLGNTLLAGDLRSYGYRSNLVTTEKFIEVVVRAQNKGKTDTRQGTWDLGNIVDSEGRNFLPASGASWWLPRPNPCGAVLKPEFEPTPCTQIYEVSRASEKLVVLVTATGAKGKKEQAWLDLNITQ